MALCFLLLVRSCARIVATHVPKDWRTMAKAEDIHTFSSYLDFVVVILEDIMLVKQKKDCMQKYVDDSP